MAVTGVYQLMNHQSPSTSYTWVSFIQPPSAAVTDPTFNPTLSLNTQATVGKGDISNVFIN